MKAIKILLWVVLVLVGLAVALVAIVLSSASLQTSLAQRLAPAELSLTKVHLGFTGLTIEDVAWQQAEVHIALERVDAKFSLMRAARRRQLDIETLTVTGLLVDLSRVTAVEDDEPALQPDAIERPAPAPETPREPAPPVDPEPPVFAGLFAEDIPLPPVTLQALALDARVILPGGLQVVEGQITGAIDPQAAAPNLALQLTLTDATADAPLQTARLNQEVVLKLSAEQLIKGMRSTGLAHLHLWHEEQLTEFKVATNLAAQQKADATGESYELVVTIGPADTDPVEALRLTAGFDYAAQVLDGDWRLTLRSDAAATLADPFLNGAMVAMESAGRFSADPASGRLQSSGTATLDADQLDRLQAELAAIGNLNLNVTFDLAADEDQLMINAFDLALHAPQDRLLAQIQTEQPFGYDNRKGAALADDHAAPLARIALLGLPVDLVNAFLPDLELGLEALSAEWRLTADEEDALHLSSVQPLSLQSLSLVINDEDLLDRLSIQIPLQATLRAGQLDFQIAPLTLSSSDQDIGSLDLSGTWSDATEPAVAELQANWALDLPLLFAQPFAEPFRNLATGELTGRLDATAAGEHVEGDLVLGLGSLTLANDPAERLEALEVQAGFALKEDNRIQLQAPVTAQRDAEQTALRIDLTAHLPEDHAQADIHINGDTVWLDHFLLLAAAFQNPDYTPPEPQEEIAAVPDPVEPPPADEPKSPAAESEDTEVAPPPPQSLWAGLTADLALTLERLMIAGQPPITAIVVEAHIDDERAELTKLEAHMLDSPIRAAGGLRFDPLDADHYRLAANLAVEAFDVGAFLREQDPETPPVLEAKLNVAGNFAAAAPTVDELGERLTGDFAITANDAVVRAFRNRAGRVTDAVGTAGRLAGRITGREEVDAVGELIQYFNRLHFDELAIAARRRPDLTIKIERLDLRNPELMILGHGRVDHVADREFHQQPVRLEFEIGARPPLSRWFDELRLLEAEARDDGYRRVNRPLTLEGNLNEPDSRPLWAIIIDAGRQRLLPDRRSGESSEDDQPADERPRRESPLDRLQQFL